MDDCDSPVSIVKWQLCNKHYIRKRLHGSPEWEPAKTPETCCIHECEKPHYGGFLCNMHYMRLRRTGSTSERVVRPTDCAARGCKVETRGTYCGLHYGRKWRHGDANAKVRVFEPRESDLCKIDDCNKPFASRGYCHHHLYALNIDGCADRHREKMRRHYEENKDYYLMRTQRRMRKVRDGLSEFELAQTRAHRKRIKNDPCAYCGGPGEHYDHVFPVAKGGTDHWTNIVRACGLCNRRKGAHCGTWFILRHSRQEAAAVA